MTIDELIAALKQATGPSREMDAAVDICITGGSAADLAYVLEPMQGEAPGASIERTLRPLSYTASIDAALTLVPADTFWRVGHNGEGADPSDFRADVMMGGLYSTGIASTPALALCIAALRARQATP